jgi:hypothetical protein
MTGERRLAPGPRALRLVNREIISLKRGARLWWGTQRGPFLAAGRERRLGSEPWRSHLLDFILDKGEREGFPPPEPSRDSTLKGASRETWLGSEFHPETTFT